MYPDTKLTKFPTITMKAEVYRKLTAYADVCNSEISALGSAKLVDGKILIDDIFLFDQVVSGTSTVLSPKDISHFICDYVAKGKDPSVLKFWWHSHVNMGAFWSSTDTGTIDKFSSDWMISMVSNKQNEFKIRLDVFSPFRMYADDLPLTIDYYEKEFNAKMKKEVDLKVKEQYFPFVDMFPNRLSSVAPPMDRGVLSYDIKPETSHKLGEAPGNRLGDEVKKNNESTLSSYEKARANVPQDPPSQLVNFAGIPTVKNPVDKPQYLRQYQKRNWLIELICGEKWV